MYPNSDRGNINIFCRKLPRLLWSLSFILFTTFAYSQDIYFGNNHDTGPQCHCLNSATNLTDGQFLDTVTVNSGVAGESWTVAAVMGARTNVTPFDAITTGTALTETSPGIYQLIIRHTDAQGFTMQVSNGMTSLSIMNTCYYPNIAFASLPDTICLTSAPVALAPTVDNDGAMGNGSFTIDGAPATVFSAQILGEGTYTVSYTFDAGTGTPDDERDPGCISTISKDVVVPPEPNVAVIAFVNVDLGADCMAVITPDMVMSSDHPCMDDFIVTVFDQNGFPIGNTITGAQAGFQLDVRVMSAAGDFVGDGRINVTDTNAPGITCPDADFRVDVTNDIQLLSETIPATAPTFIPNNFACYDDAVADMSGRHFYTLYEFTVDQMDVYTIELNMDLVGGGVFGLYQGPFQPFQGVCQGLVGIGEDLPAGEGFFVNEPNIRRLHVMLVPGMPYTLLTTTFDGNQIADYQYAIYSEGAGRVNNVSSVVGSIMLPLYCSSLTDLINNPASLALLGEPIIDDPCNSNPAVTFDDDLVSGGNCGVSTLTRTFTVTDNFNNSSSCTQVVDFPPITLEEVNLPPQVFNISCDETFVMDPNGNPSPELTGYPFVITAEGTFDLAPVYCNMLASYEDGATIMVCSGTDQFVRTWTVFDNCNTPNFRTFQQLIIIGDRLGPMITCSAPDTDFDGLPDTLVYSTQSDVCVASFEVPLPTVTDNCSNWSVVTELVTIEQVPVRNPLGTIIGFTEEERILAVIRANDPRFVNNIPVGMHSIRYTATDDCGNMSVNECPIRVEDLSAPAAVCDDQLNVSIGGNGQGNVMAEDIDEGSSDNCGPVTLQIRRLIDFDLDDCQIPAPPMYTSWGPDIDLFCCEAGSTIEAQLLVTDINGFTNTCSANIFIEDNTAPICIAPQPVVTTCVDLPADFDFEDINLLQVNFGMAEVQDACGDAQITELTPIVTMERCGLGSIIRRFEAQDPSGNTNSCQQLIQINGSSSYQIKFPKDVIGSCATPDADTLVLNNFGCDEFMVRSVDERFDAIDEGACYKILRTYTVINWCEYDGFSDPIEVTRNAACLPRGGMQDIWVHRLPDGRAYYDADDDPFNNFPLANSRGTSCGGTPNPNGHWRQVPTNGYWTYTQLIKVIDAGDPVITVNQPEAFCSINDDCTATGTINFTVTDDCMTTLTNISATIDANRTGLFDQPIPVSGTFPDFQITGEFPIGQHRARFTVNDDCGGAATAFVDFEVVDCKAVGLVCSSNITVNLMPQPPGVDVDGDGQIDVGAAAINVNNFILSVTEDCTGPLRYTIHRASEVDAGRDVPFPNHPALVVNCDDIGSIPVRVYAWDSANNPFALQPDGTIGGPNFAICSSTLSVADNLGLCQPGTSGRGNIAGLIMTETGEPVSGVEISPRDDMMSEMTVTEENGLFDFSLQATEGYQVTPYSGEDFKNGVTTFDIILVSKHILGVQTLDSPYKLIAADVNRSGSISTLDIIHMRKTILGIHNEFPDNTSWRFVTANYEFPDPTDPWAEIFPEALAIPSLNGDVNNADFIAVKIGDVNDNARANWLSDPDDRALGNPYYLRTDDLDFEGGDNVEAIFSSANADDWIQGFQFTLQFDPQLLEWENMEEGLLNEQHVNTSKAAQGLLTISWDAGSDFEKQGEYSFLNLRFRAKQHGKLSEAIGITSRITEAEAYGIDDGVRGIALNFSLADKTEEGFFLEQNRPNPFGDQTIIGFQIPESGTVTLSIYDTNGKTVQRYQQFFSAGYNQFLVDAQDIAARGLLYYKLETDRYAATKKMVILE